MATKTRGPDKRPRQKTKKTRAELLERWRAKASRAIRVRDEWERKFDVEKGENFFLGIQREQGSEERIYNHLWATIRTQEPNLFYTKPKFYVRPRPGRDRPVDEMKASTGESVLEAIGDQNQNLKRAGSLAVLQNFFRIGVLKMVYDPRLEPNPRVGETIMALDANDDPILDPVTKEPRELRDPRTNAVIKEPAEIVTDEAYRYEWIDAKLMLLPDEGPDRLKWTWLGQQVIVPLEEAKDDPRFPAWRSQLVANITSYRPGERPRQEAVTEGEKAHELLMYFEVYDLRNKRMMIWADDQSGTPAESFLVEDVLPEGIEDHPYALLLGYTPILGPDPSPWPMPHVHPWLDPQAEYNFRRCQITEGARRSARKIGYDAGTFVDPDQAKNALRSSRDMEGVELSNIDRPWIVIADPDLNQSIYKDIIFQRDDWQRITGQTGARLGDPDADTATEAAITDRAGNLRDADMQDTINDWLSEAGMKMLQLVKKTLTLKMWVQIRGFQSKEFLEYIERVYQIPREAAGAFPGLKEIFMERFAEAKWQPITRETLQFEATVTVVPGSSRPKNLDVERSQWMQFLRLIGQFPQIALSRELLRLTAEKFETIPERVVDELNALAQKMVDVNARQAGRDQGGGQDGGGGAGGLPGILQAALGGGGAT